MWKWNSLCLCLSTLPLPRRRGRSRSKYRHGGTYQPQRVGPGPPVTSSPSRTSFTYNIVRSPTAPHIRVKLPSLLSVRINSRLDLLTNLRGLRTATSYGDIQDALPTDDLSEEEIGFYDDDVDVAFPRKGKGKARVRVESDDEPEDGGKEGCIEATPSRSSTAPPSPNLKTIQRAGGAGELLSPVVALPFPTTRTTRRGTLNHSLTSPGELLQTSLHVQEVTLSLRSDCLAAC